MLKPQVRRQPVSEASGIANSYVCHISAGSFFLRSQLQRLRAAKRCSNKCKLFARDYSFESGSDSRL